MCVHAYFKIYGVCPVFRNTTLVDHNVMQNMPNLNIYISLLDVLNTADNLIQEIKKTSHAHGPSHQP